MIDRKALEAQSEDEKPYCFRVGDTLVRISFKEGEKTLEEKLKAYFLGLKTV